jgi:filamentous hemagglutinin
LNEQALWNRVLADPAAGRDLPGLSGDQRFAQSAGFMKMEATHKLPDGSSITVHYQYNSTTGKAYDMKIVTPQPQPSVLQPGPSFTPKK